MKNVLLSLIFLFSITFAKAQDCTTLFPLQDNASFEYTYYDKKGKTTNKQQQTVRFIEEIPGGVSAEFDSRLLDADDSLLTESSFIMTCQDNVYHVDFEGLMNGMMSNMSPGGDIEMKFTGNQFSFPTNLEAGMILEDVQITADMMANATKIMSMDINITDRKVEGKEKIETKAGQFDTYLITSKTTVKSIMSNTSYSKQWLCPGIGIVKQETYNKKMKADGSMKLTSYSID